MKSLDAHQVTGISFGVESCDLIEIKTEEFDIENQIRVTLT
jgi:hypothetical protein